MMVYTSIATASHLLLLLCRRSHVTEKLPHHLHQHGRRDGLHPRPTSLRTGNRRPESGERYELLREKKAEPVDCDF